MSNRWDTILTIFDAVRDAPTAERPALLSDRCGSDGGLRAEVESLLEHDVQAEPAFLAPKEIGEFHTDQADPLIGRIVAGYSIKEVIARGGMGTVYLAEQEKPRREVALKILQAGLWTRSAAKRFDAESHILGYLRHPNIAHVYEAGATAVEVPLKRESLLVSDAEGIPIPTEEGARKDSRTSILRVHYFAMEYVPDARPITQYADAHSLTQRARLELFLQLCDAVAYGHQKGVIHRDLKPANVLVSAEQLAPGDSPGAKWGRGIVKVIDFGIARATDSDIAVTTMHTDAGQLLGTLAYMSPEQCAADPSRIDTTTDVYSLGVILYELLTGRMPYDVSNMTIQSAARIICEQEPARPSIFNRRLRGDAETIILKAIEKSSARRYQSVSDLSDDIRRLINGEPISARPPTAYSRLLRWAARRPKEAAIVVGAFLASLIVGAATVSIIYVRRTPTRLLLTTGGNSRDTLRNRETRHGDLAELYSPSGEVLRSWSAEDDHGIRCAFMLTRPGALVAKDVVVIGYAAGFGREHRNHLCAFDATSGDLIWKKTVDQACIAAMPDSAWPRPPYAKDRMYRPEDFGVAHGWAFDIFDDADHPGKELVIFHQHAQFSQGVLRIYDFRGEILYSAWQDGGIGDVAWLPGERLLICIAPKADRDEVSLRDHSESRHPQVIFAIRPLLNQASTGWIHPYQPDWGNAKWEEPVWYKTYCPKEYASGWQFIPTLRRPHELPSQFDPANHVLVYLRADPDSRFAAIGNVGIVIDSSGKIVHRFPLGDGARHYFDAHPEAPNLEQLDLVEWNSKDFPCASQTRK